MIEAKLAFLISGGTGSGKPADGLPHTNSVELHGPIDSPSFVLLVWPAAPTVTNADPKALASIAAATVCVVARRKHNRPRSERKMIMKIEDSRKGA
jgi:hypothetical protein